MAFAAYPFSNNTPSFAIESIFGVINEPSLATPLYKETSLKPKSSARIIIILGLESLLSLSFGPSCQSEEPSDKIGLVIFKIFGNAQTIILTRFLHTTNDKTAKSVRGTNSRFIF